MFWKKLITHYPLKVRNVYKYLILHQGKSSREADIVLILYFVSLCSKKKIYLGLTRMSSLTVMT